MLDALSNSDSRFLRNLSKIGERMQRAEDQLSSGLRVKTASDAPDQISSLLQLRAQLASNDQVQSNLGRMKTEVDTAESAMQEAVSILEKIKTLGAQGANSNQTPEARKTLAEDIEAQLQNLVGLTNTKVDGRYVFSGDSDSVAPYTLDLTVNPPVSIYAGTASTREMAMPGGERIAVAKTAQEIFDSAIPSENVFGAITALRDALLANDQTAIEASMDQIQPAEKFLNSQLAFYGRAQNQILQGTNRANSMNITLQAEIANIEEADAASAILELQQATFQQDAAMAAHAQIPRRTLFDYLK